MIPSLSLRPSYSSSTSLTALPLPYSSTPDLGNRIYALLASDTTIRTELGLHTEDSNLVKRGILPRLLAIRDSVLSKDDPFPGDTSAFSSKESFLEFGSYGKVAMRFKNRATYFTLPHMPDHEGGVKIVKYMVRISSDGSQISLEMMSKIKKEHRTKENCRIFIEQASILQTFSHPNILVPTEILTPSEKKGYELVTPKCETDLFEWIRETINPSKDIASQTKDCIRFMQEITSAMKYVYDRGYLHCDLKPENILLERDPHGTLKTRLTDFDFLTRRDDASESIKGNEGYIPPSYLRTGRRNDLYSELYALGKTFHARPDELCSLTHRLSWLEYHAEHAGNKRLSKAIHTLIEDVSFLSAILIEHKISDYTVVLDKLRASAFRFNQALLNPPVRMDTARKRL
jgi:hypothetical protein